MFNPTHSDQDANSDSVTSMIGIIQALVSIFLDDGDKLCCINAGSTRIVFLLRPPLYYVCVSSWGEPESVVSMISPPLINALADVCEARLGSTSSISICRF